MFYFCEVLFSSISLFRIFFFSRWIAINRECQNSMKISIAFLPNTIIWWQDSVEVYHIWLLSGNEKKATEMSRKDADWKNSALKKFLFGFLNHNKLSGKHTLWDIHLSWKIQNNLHIACCCSCTRYYFIEFHALGDSGLDFRHSNVLF